MDHRERAQVALAGAARRLRWQAQMLGMAAGLLRSGRPGAVSEARRLVEAELATARPILGDALWEDMFLGVPLEEVVMALIGAEADERLHEGEAAA